MAETTVLLALVEVGTALEELLNLTVVEAIVVLTAAMLVEDALTLLVVAGASHPSPHPKDYALEPLKTVKAAKNRTHRRNRKRDRHWGPAQRWRRRPTWRQQGQEQRHAFLRVEC